MKGSGQIIMEIDEKKVYRAFHDAVSMRHRGQYYVSLASNEFYAFKIEQPLLQDCETYKTWDEFTECYIEKYVFPAHQEEIRKFFDRRSISEQLSKQNREISALCQIEVNGITYWIEHRIILSDMYATEKVDHVMVLLVEKEEVSATERDRLELEAIRNAISGGLKVNNDDEKYSIRYISPKLAKMLGYTVEEVKRLIATSSEHFFKESQIEEILRQMAIQTANGDEYSLKYCIRGKDGRFIWVRDKGKKIKDEKGQGLYYSVVVDIDEAERQAEALREAIEVATSEKRKYRDAITHSAVYAYEYDITTDMLTEEFHTANGRKYLEQWGLKVPCAYSDFLEHCRKAFKVEFLAYFKQQYLTKEGLLEAFYAGESQVEIEVYLPETNSYIRTTHLMSINEKDGHVYDFVYGTDITEVRREEELSKKALQASYEAAKEANALKTDFLSKMSHDMRTPMNAIIGLATIAQNYIDDKARVEDALAKIHTSSKHLLALIDNVLDMSKIESGKMTLSIEAFSLASLINDLLFMVQPQLRAHDHKLHVSPSYIAHEEVIGDPMRIQQIFMNILGNAIKYTPDGGDIYFSLEEKATKQNNIRCYEMIVEDNGIGMSQSFIKEIFDPFSRAEDLRTSRIQGTGLGMAIAKHNIEMMHGSIEVESEENVGSKFTVNLFLAVQNKGEMIVEGLDKHLVLTVGEDQNTCMRVCGMLDEIGIKNKWADNKAQAIEYLMAGYEKKEIFDAIIIDGEMDEGKGIEIANELKKCINMNETSIILSVYTGSYNEEEARKDGSFLFINRPIFRSSLLELFTKDHLSKAKVVPKDELEILKTMRLANKRILIVEDNELNCEIAREILMMTGVAVDEVHNGQEAVRIISESEIGYYDLVFMDVQMPVMNGYIATRKIRELARPDVMNLPIIAMTANAFSEDIKESKLAGMNGHLSKPIELKKLLEVFNKWLK